MNKLIDSIVNRKPTGTRGVRAGKQVDKQVHEQVDEQADWLHR